MGYGLGSRLYAPDPRRRRAPEGVAPLISRYVFTLWAIGLPLAMAGMIGAIYCGARLGVNAALLITGLFAVALFPAAGLLALIPALVAIGMHKFATSNESWL